MAATLLMSTLSTVVICDGTAEKIMTVQQTGETVADFVQRHVDAVAAARVACGGTSSLNPTEYTTPVDCAGVVSHVFTVQNTGEAFGEMANRHHNSVRAAVSECP